MNNFNGVFTTISESCKEPNTPNYKCFQEIQKMADSKKYKLSVTCYLEMLEEMELIRFNRSCKTIALTEKGKSTDKLFNY